MTQRLRPAVSEPVILMFSRSQVETCNVDEPLQLLRRLTEDRQTAIDFCGRISLVVDGYNDDPRELFEVPEVRAYIKRLDQAWPSWFFFLSQADESIKLLESCLCETIEVVPGVTSIRPGAARALAGAALHGDAPAPRGSGLAGEDVRGSRRGYHRHVPECGGGADRGG